MRAWRARVAPPLRRAAHVELQDRITALHDEFIMGAVNNVIKKLSTEPTAPPPLYGPAAPDFGREGETAKKLMMAAAVGVAVAAIVFMRRK